MDAHLPDIDKTGLVDPHCHILAGVDDGSRDMAESLELIRQAYAQGFRTFIATPHYRRTHDNPDIERLTAELADRIKQNEELSDVDIYPGQEGLWHEEYPERIESGQARSLAGSSYILCEFDYAAAYTQIARGLRAIADTGHTPVLAHFERYAALREGGRAYEIKRMGVVMQMNYEALVRSGASGRSGPSGEDGIPHRSSLSSIRDIFDTDLRWCRRQVTDGIVDILATDMHRTDFRPPDTLAAQKWLKSKLTPTRFNLITRRNALHIIRDEVIEM